MSDAQNTPDAAVRRVMVVEDDNSFGELLRYQLKREGFEPFIVRSGEEALARLAEIDPDVILMDIMLPGIDGCSLLGEIHPLHKELPIVMMTAAGSVEMAVDCMKRGAYDFLTKPFDFDRLQAILRNALQYRELKARVQALEGALVKAHGFEQIVAHSKQMRLMLDQARRASVSDSDILILGESGTGKEVLARAMHFNSQRKSGPFVAINCGAIPESLLESELFGHEKGAFTGAIGRRAGCFEQAHGGTLFLDEIGEMRPDMQVRLLRALENREIRRVGGDRTIKVNARVISATNQDIATNIKNSSFRVDLYYRLAILVLELPTLRERPEDIGPLAVYFLDEARKEGHTRCKGFTQQAMDVFMKYNWPGNVRELRNAVERSVVFEDGLFIAPPSLPPDILKATLGPQAVPPPKLTETYTPEQFKAMLAASAGPGGGAVPVTGSSNRETVRTTPPTLPNDAGAAPVSPIPVVAAGSQTGAPAPLGQMGQMGQLGPASAYTNIDPALLRGPADGEILTLDEEEKRIILRTLSITGGNISDAARRLGVHRSTLHRKMTRYGLATEEELAAGSVENSEA